MTKSAKFWILNLLAAALLWVGMSSTALAQQITMERAVEIAQALYPDAQFDSAELETKRGRLVYEVELKNRAQRMEYEVHIDANTGEVIRTHEERD